ncbi:MAG: hypothetical protein ACYTF1_08570 [Planctomycetota bacterium]
MATTWPADLAYLNDDTKALEKVIKLLPPFGATTIPTGVINGKRWVHVEDWKKLRESKGATLTTPNPLSTQPASLQLDHSESLSGEWSPSTRLQQAELVKYLESPGVEERLDTIASLCGQEISPCPESRPSIQVRWIFSDYIYVARLLTARARYYLAHKNDFDRAISNIEAVISLGANLEDDYYSIAIIVGMAIRGLAASEVANWPGEYDLTRDRIEELMQLVYRYPIKHIQSWKTYLLTQYAYSKAFVDCMYTKGDDGNGWLVMHDIEDKYRVCCLYNLLSPVYDDRNTVGKKLALYYEKMDEVIKLRFSEVSDFIKSINHAYQSPTDVLSLEFRQSGRVLFWCFRNKTEYDNGQLIALALAAYHREHSRYPNSLVQLVPQYISSLPDDPFVNKPFCYRLDDRDGYVLYSVGEDCVDDGGRLRDSNGKLIPHQDQNDIFIYSQRSEPYDDWFLVPVGTTTQKSDDIKP